MSKQKTYLEANKSHFKTLSQYVPIVDRVHGGNHPEFHEVRQVFDAIHQKVQEAGSKRPQLNEDFETLRSITSNYSIPADVCESYEAVYNMLSEIDKAYQG